MHFAMASEEVVGDNKINAKTSSKRKKLLAKFKAYLADKGQPDLETLLGDVSLLETALVRFFREMRVQCPKTKVEVRPKWAYIEAIKSHLKVELSRLADYKVNISHRSQFPKLHAALGELAKDLASEGRLGTTPQATPIPASTLTAILIIFNKLQDVLLARKANDGSQYAEALETLPESFRNNYNDLLRLAVIFTLLWYNCAKGRETFVKLTMHQFVQVTKSGEEYYQFVRHANGGQDEYVFIPMEEKEEDHGRFSPGILLEFYLSALNRSTNILLQKSIRCSHSFNIHDLSKTVLYDSTQVGENKTGNTMKILCGLVGAPPLSNGAIRQSVIQLAHVEEEEEQPVGDDSEVVDSKRAVNPKLLSRYLFNARSQLGGESTESFMSNLRHLSTMCHFSQDSLDDVIRDRFIAGIYDEQLRTKLLALPFDGCSLEHVVTEAFKRVSSNDPLEDDGHKASDMIKKDCTVADEDNTSTFDDDTAEVPVVYRDLSRQGLEGNTVVVIKTEDVSKDDPLEDEGHKASDMVICDNCGDEMTFGRLKSHLLKCAGDSSLICDLCSKQFSRPETLRTHNERVHQGKRDVCEECGKR
jgi:hypothetical protein